MDFLGNLFGRSKAVEFNISLKDEENRAEYRLELLNNQVFFFPIYGAKEDLSGVVDIHIPNKGRLEHTGITIELYGVLIDFTTGATVHEFLHEEKRIEKPGVIMGKKVRMFLFRHNEALKFSFKKISKKYESYYGINVRVRYYLRVVATRAMGPNLTEEKEVWIIKKDSEPTSNKNIKMEVGIEDCLHIEFQYNQEKYHLSDVIMGNIHFLLAKIKIQHMDIELVRKEYVGESSKEVVEQEVIGKFEIMDGMPVRDEVIPVRIYLRPYDLTPSFKNVCKIFSVKYFINLVLIDSEEKRFFKQQEITLWRATETIT